MKINSAVVGTIAIYTVAARYINIQSAGNEISNFTSSLHEARADAFSLPHPAQGFFDDDVASDADWKTYTNKGGALMCGLLGTDQTAGRQLNDARNPPSAASAWKGNLKQELETWYWRHVNPATYTCKMNDHWNIPFAMRSLGLNGKPTSEGGDNACFRVEHWDPDKKEGGKQVPAINQWYKVGDKDYRSTKAHYEFGINTKGGAVFAFFLESPKSAARTLWYAGKKDASPEDLPRLRALSDVLWGFWNRDNTNIKNIRYFFMVGISNDQTNQLIASCLQKAGKELSEWPGTSFSTETDEGHALVGSPNGAAFAYFLMQHKAELGYKTISKVVVFKPETDDDDSFVDPSLAFYVEDAPEPPPDNAEMADTGNKGKNIVRTHKL